MSESWDQKLFNSTLEDYIEHSKKDLATILNTKAYYIARKAIWFTRKTELKTIRQLRTIATTRRERKPSCGGVMLGAMISGRRGVGKGLYGNAMAVAFEKVLGARAQSLAFLKAGWLPAVKTLFALSENPSQGGPMDATAIQRGAAKGSASAAYSAKLMASITNTAQSKTDTRDALNTIGKRGLEFAFEDETASMDEYIERKAKIRADEANRVL